MLDLKLRGTHQSWTLLKDSSLVTSYIRMNDEVEDGDDDDDDDDDDYDDDDEEEETGEVESGDDECGVFDGVFWHPEVTSAS